MNKRIGTLMRKGKTVYYAYIKGEYVERRTLGAMEHCLLIGDTEAESRWYDLRDPQSESDQAWTNAEMSRF